MCVPLSVTPIPVSLSLPAGGGPSSLPADMADFELPSYDDLVGDSPEDEPVMDENERIALQEQEDARIAQELFEKERQATLAEVIIVLTFNFIVARP